jgi:hypothetical protein
MISRPLKIAVLACAVWMTGCGARDAAPPSAQSAKPAVVISQVRVDRTAFDPAKQETVTVRFNLSEPADVALVLYDGRDHQVYRQDA